jgi:hypothetical protein
VLVIICDSGGSLWLVLVAAATVATNKDVHERSEISEADRTKPALLKVGREKDFGNHVVEGGIVRLKSEWSEVER